MNQTRLESFIEQTLNVGSGFVLSFAVWAWIVAPLIRAGHLSIDHNLAITLIFTVVSLIRGYVWRRVFDKNIHKEVHKWVMQFVNRATTN